MPTGFYRYISSPGEVTQIVDQRKVHSTNAYTRHATWYTPTRFDIPADAQRELALPSAPTHRVGPISAAEMPSFAIGLRVVAPAFGSPGGGVEAYTYDPVWLPGLWEFAHHAWEW